LSTATETVRVNGGHEKQRPCRDRNFATVNMIRSIGDQHDRTGGPHSYKNVIATP
jgi:hypothetical protein